MNRRRIESLERSIARGAGPEAEAQLVRELCARGRLAPEGMTLAACCGHQGAAMALGERGREALAAWRERDVGDWLRGMADTTGGRFAGRVMVHACVATLGKFHDYGHWLRCRIEGACPCGGLDSALVAITCAKAWIACPCRWHEKAASASTISVGTIQWWHWPSLIVAHLTRKGATPASGARCVSACLAALREARIDADAGWLRASIAEALIAHALGRDLPLPELPAGRSLGRWPPKTDF